MACCLPAFSQENVGGIPAPAPSRPKRIRVSSKVLGATLEHGVVPVYPEKAIRAAIKGNVTLMVQTDETGRVVRGLPVEGDPLLVASSIEALKEFRFRPYLVGETALSVESEIGFRFTLKDEAGRTQGGADYIFDVPYRSEFSTHAVFKEGVLVRSPKRASGPDPLALPELLGQSGVVYLVETIRADGKVEEVKVVGGDEAVAGPVVAAVQQCVFEPQLVDGEPSPVTVQEAYRYGPKRN